MTERRDTFGLAVLIGISVWWGTSQSMPATMHTVYRATCEAETCRASAKADFSAFPQAQAVIYRDATGIVSALKGCAVLDAENWTCIDPNNSYFMVNGELSASIPEPSIRFVSWRRWYWLRAIHLLD